MYEIIFRIESFVYSFMASLFGSFYTSAKEPIESWIVGRVSLSSGGSGVICNACGQSSLPQVWS